MRITEGVLERGDLSTWYQVHGELGADGGRAPLVVCHGGPGLTHDYLSPVKELAKSGRPVVFYDQFGNGRSGHRRDAPAEFWTVPFFLRELTDLLDHLGISRGHHLLGHSWGGMLGLELAASAPAGLRSLVVADAFARAQTYTEEVGALVAALPEDVRATIERHEAAGTTDDPEYEAAVRVFYRQHVCRRRPVPDEVLRTSALSARTRPSTTPWRGRANSGSPARCGTGTSPAGWPGSPRTCCWCPAATTRSRPPRWPNCTRRCRVRAGN